MKRLKIHFYGLRYYFLVFLLLFVGYASLSITVIDNHLSFLLPILFAFLLLIILILGVYEYNRIAYMHRAILVNRKPFFICSMMFGIFCIAFVLGVFIGYAFLVNHFHMIDISFVYNPYFYLIFISLFCSIYTIGNFYGLTFAKYPKVNSILVLILFILFIYFSLQFSDIINFIHSIIYLQFNNILIIGLLLFIVFITISFINKLIFSKKN